MQIEDYHKQYFNAVNYGQLKEFEIVEKESQIRMMTKQFEEDVAMKEEENAELAEKAELLTRELHDLQTQVEEQEAREMAGHKSNKSQTHTSNIHTAEAAEARTSQEPINQNQHQPSTIGQERE